MKNYPFSHIKFLCYAAIAILFSACATPKPVLRLKPVDAETQFYFGKEYVTHLKDSIMMSLAFEQNEDEQFIMDLEIINQSQSRILIDPAQFFYQFYDSTNKANPITQQINAIDPEKEILEAEKEMSRAIARGKNERAFLIGTAILATTAAVAVAVSPTKEERVSKKTETPANQYNIQQQQTEKLDDVFALTQIAGSALEGTIRSAEFQGFRTQNLKALKENWEKFPLRKTHLFPEESIQGKIVFDRILKNGYLMFYFPLEWINHQFLFKQQLNLVYPPR